MNQRVIHNALIGAGIGAAVGFAAAVLVTQQQRVKDHSEDTLAFMYLTAYGAAAGAVTGIILTYLVK